MNKKNILFISSWFPNKLEPTNGNFVQRHAEAVSLLHHVEILHAIGDTEQKEKYIFDEQLIKGLKTLIVYYKNTKNPLLNFLRRMKAYKKGFVQMQKPDLVHANILHNNMLFAVYLKKKFSIPFVVTEHWTVFRKENENTTPTKIKKIAKIIGNRASIILPVSENLEYGLKNLGIKTPMKVIPNVVNTSLFSKKTIKDKEFTFIHVSNLISRKNPDKILRVALKLLENGYDIKLKIGGDGDILPLKNIANSSKFSHKIEIFGIQPIEKIAEKMQSSDCFILFSNDENQPCVIAESFASGLQVISTNVGGIAEFFPKNAGILLDKVDEQLLEKAMITILESNISNETFLINYAKNTFSAEIIAEKYSAVYSEVLK